MRRLSESEKIIVDANHKLIYGYANHKGLDVEEWYGQLAIELCKAVMVWDSNISKLSTFYYTVCDNMLKDEWERRSRQKRDSGELLQYNDNHYQGEDAFDEWLFTDNLKSCGPEYEDIVDLRLQGYTQGEIAKLLSMNQSTVSRRIADLQRFYREGHTNNGK